MMHILHVVWNTVMVILSRYMELEGPCSRPTLLIHSCVRPDTLLQAVRKLSVLGESTSSLLPRNSTSNV